LTALHRLTEAQVRQQVIITWKESIMRELAIARFVGRGNRMAIGFPVSS
jgi:hypothetical protein